jgi:hypothetical protein
MRSRAAILYEYGRPTTPHRSARDPDNTGRPAAWLVTTPGVVNKKLRVPA